MKQTLEQASNIVSSIQKLIEREQSISQLEYNILQDLCDAASELNSYFYHSPKLKIQKTYDLTHISDIHSFLMELEQLTHIWTYSISVRNAANSIDEEFWDIYEYFKYVDPSTIYNNSIQNFVALPEYLKKEFLTLPTRYTFLKNQINYLTEDFSLIDEHISMLSSQIENYRWLYEHLEDYRSKKILNGIIKYWFTFDIDQMHRLTETLFSSYYDLDILKCSSDEIFVDLGAYIGDSIISYLDTYGDYKRIYAYEITPRTVEILKDNLKDFKNIIACQKGVGNANSLMYINDFGNGTGNSISEQGNIAVPVVTLDEDILEPITTIKMDIEGAEKDALIGCTRHIKSEKPKLLISAYHLPADIFDIPNLINGIRDDYKFYLRFNGHGCIWPCDYVLLVI